MKTVIDVGCGDGRNLCALVRAGFICAGIDLSSTALARAHDRLTAQAQSAFLIQADASHLPLASGTIDCMTAFDVFGQIAVRMGYVTTSQLSECLREQARQHGDGTSLRLGQLLLKKKFLSNEQFLAVMRAQKKQVVKCPACDTFYDVQDRPGEVKFACTNCNAVVEVSKQL